MKEKRSSQFLLENLRRRDLPVPIYFLIKTAELTEVVRCLLYPHIYIYVFFFSYPGAAILLEKKKIRKEIFLFGYASSQIMDLIKFCYI